MIVTCFRVLGVFTTSYDSMIVKIGHCYLAIISLLSLGMIRRVLIENPVVIHKIYNP